MDAAGRLKRPEGIEEIYAKDCGGFSLIDPFHSSSVEEWARAVELEVINASELTDLDGTLSLQRQDQDVRLCNLMHERPDLAHSACACLRLRIRMPLGHHLSLRSGRHTPQDSKIHIQVVPS